MLSSVVSSAYMMGVNCALATACARVSACVGVCRRVSACVGVCRRVSACVGVCRRVSACVGVCRRVTKTANAIAIVMTTTNKHIHTYGCIKHQLVTRLRSGPSLPFPLSSSLSPLSYSSLSSTLPPSDYPASPTITAFPRYFFKS